MAHAYIVYPKSLDKFYTGSSSGSLNERLRRHLSNHSGFTSRAKDWEIFYFETFENITSARKRENEIKAWKSKVMIWSLIK